MSRNRPGFPHGDQVIKVAVGEIRALGFLPRDVQVLGTIKPAPESVWIPYTDTQYLYLHITSATCFDRPEGTPLCIEPLFEFYERYATLKTALVADLNHWLSVYQGG